MAPYHQTYKGKLASIIRAARDGDDGYDIAKVRLGQQILVRTEDGTEVIFRHQLVDTMPPGPDDGPAPVYQGHPVVVVRDAYPADAGYVEGDKDQVLIRMGDGSERVMPRAEL